MEIHKNTPAADQEAQAPTSLPIRTIRCPRCFHSIEMNCEGLQTKVDCPNCHIKYSYLDGYLTYYREYPELFIDQVHALPLVPGFSTSGRVLSAPNDLLIIEFGITYRRPPDVFFLVDEDRAARQWIANNQVLLPLSTCEHNFILFSRIIERSLESEPAPVNWMALGETGDWAKPLWLQYLNNGASLVRQEEDVAAIVMLTMALDFYYDAVLAKVGVDFNMIRKRGRKRGMNEKRAKLMYIREILGEWPANFEGLLGDLTDYRNQLVHGINKDTSILKISGRKSFQIVMRAVMFLIEMLYRSEAEIHPKNT
ncbi:MAG TPA: hypothetical protein ENH10_05840 [Bacteroidetes bacterium]|nr:hypothetical protein BMS3Bbin04_01246 [bacterium BMS3Bbin04]HDO65540.1 hypothetical protein [Bacteroidota bacterium]HEX04665.1 hypothetical protein [Bacteroidota bacterium]